VPFDPESKGGAEATVKIAKADLVSSGANLLQDCGSFVELQEACQEFRDRLAEALAGKGVTPLAT